jgi:hypothetical protein
MIIELTKKRSANRTWWAELDWLQSKGYTSFLNGFDARWAESTPCCRCGHHRMEYRGFTIAGLVNRSYALCDRCEHWLEF